MDKQQTYDLCVEHLRKQKQRSIIVQKGEIIGAYRGQHDLKSPVGFLLGVYYIPEFEGLTLKDSLVHWIVEKQLKHNFALCLDFEKMHDTIDPRYWENEFQCIATIHKLIYRPTSYRVIKIDEDRLIGYLSFGKFVSLEKAQHIPQFPSPVPIYLSQIGNYSQICSISKLLVIDNLRSLVTNDPICMFPH